MARRHLLVPKIDVPVVHTTGGGDALTAALAVAVLRGVEPRQAACQAAASITVGRPAGRPNLDPAALHRALDQIDEALRRRDGSGH